jgi:hypothetical protein
MDIPELAKKTESDAKHAETTVRVDVEEAKSWFSENKEPAIMIAVGFLVIGFIMGCLVLKLFR